MSSVSVNVTATDLATIRVLYRQADTLTLWGVPYGMRPGQSPRDLWEGRHVPDYHRYVINGFGVDLRSGPLKGWIYLGAPGWFGSLDSDSIERIKAFLATHASDVPGNPHEWSTITIDTAQRAQEGA